MIEIKNTSIESSTQGGADLPQFSEFPCGCRNRAGQDVMAKTPCGTMTLPQAQAYITSQAAKRVTTELRKIKDHKLAQVFKLQNFRIATFGGVFSTRKVSGLAIASGYMILDIDGLESEAQVQDVRYFLIHDKRIRSKMVFISPSGRGVKDVIAIDSSKGLSFKDYFSWVSMYLQFEFGIEIDRSGSDISRACYLPYDPDCWLADELRFND